LYAFPAEIEDARIAHLALCKLILRIRASANVTRNQVDLIFPLWFLNDNAESIQHEKQEKYQATNRENWNHVSNIH